MTPVPQPPTPHGTPYGVPRERVVLDVSHLPTTVFGNRDIMWWGTVGFMVIEGFTLVLCAVVWLYLRKNFSTWPPEGTPLPSLRLPTVQLVVMLASLALVVKLRRAATSWDLAGTRRWLTAAAAVCALECVMRWWDLTRSLNVRWDANAYGSAQWLVVAAHGTLLAIQLVEVVGMSAIFWRGPVEKKHFSDAADVGYYWMFIVLVWVPLYALCFLAPRWM